MSKGIKLPPPERKRNLSALKSWDGVEWYTPEAIHFQNAFYTIHKRGDFPSPTAILIEMGKDPNAQGYHSKSGRGGPMLNGRLSKLRIALLEREGYVKDTWTGRWKLNTEIPGETESTGDWR